MSDLQANESSSYAIDEPRRIEALARTMHKRDQTAGVVQSFIDWDELAPDTQDAYRTAAEQEVPW